MLRLRAFAQILGTASAIWPGMSQPDCPISTCSLLSLADEAQQKHASAHLVANPSAGPFLFCPAFCNCPVRGGKDFQNNASKSLALVPGS